MTRRTEADLKQESHEARAAICLTCGTQYPAAPAPPAACPICDDDRQYLRPTGQQWTSLVEMRGHYHTRFKAVEPGLLNLITEPAFAIGQRAYLVQTPRGNILWETLTYVDETTIAEIRAHGDVIGISISHPHYYATMVEWSRRLGGVPIYLHADNRSWVMHPADAVQFWEGDSLELLPGVTVVRCGGHFPGAAVLHWADGGDGKGVLLTGDTIQLVPDQRWVSFMYSYPNLIPLAAAAVRGIVAAVEPYPFERLYNAFYDRPVVDAYHAVRRSADRYIQHLTGEVELG